MKVGISSSCLFPLLTENALEEVFKNGERNVELFLNSPRESDKAFIKLFKSIADYYDGTITSVHPCTSECEGVSFFGRYPRRFDDCLEEYKKLFELCNEIGTDILVFHGAREILPISDERYFERYDMLNRAAWEHGVKICQENVVNFKSGNVEFIKAMHKSLGNTHFILDIKQAKRAKQDPFEMMKAMGNSLEHIHISDHNEFSDCMVPFEGNFDWNKFIKQLIDNNYDKALIIELYRQNFTKIDSLVESEKILNNIIHELSNIY